MDDAIARFEVAVARYSLFHSKAMGLFDYSIGTFRKGTIMFLGDSIEICSGDGEPIRWMVPTTPFEREPLYRHVVRELHNLPQAYFDQTRDIEITVGNRHGNSCTVFVRTFMVGWARWCLTWTKRSGGDYTIFPDP